MSAKDIATVYAGVTVDLINLPIQKGVVIGYRVSSVDATVVVDPINHAYGWNSTFPPMNGTIFTHQATRGYYVDESNIILPQTNNQALSQTSAPQASQPGPNPIKAIQALTATLQAGGFVAAPSSLSTTYPEAEFAEKHKGARVTVRMHGKGISHNGIVVGHSNDGVSRFVLIAKDSGTLFINNYAPGGTEHRPHLIFFEDVLPQLPKTYVCFGAYTINEIDLLLKETKAKEINPHPHKCPRCSAPALILFTSTECTSAKCPLFKKS